MHLSGENGNVLNKQDYRYSTERLLVAEWHILSSDDWVEVALESLVIHLLTPEVTQSLPPAWQGSYSIGRASEWIAQRDAEGITLLIIEKSTGSAIGFIILFGSPDSKDLRLGYLLEEASWGKGYASELIGGFINWCRHHGIHRVTGGVEPDNFASIRVLEKNGFIRDQESHGDQQIFIWRNQYSG